MQLTGQVCKMQSGNETRSHVPISHTTPVWTDEGHYKGFTKRGYPYSQEVRNLITPEYVSNTGMFSDYRGRPVYWRIDV